jgi:peroxiredoxin
MSTRTAVRLSLALAASILLAAVGVLLAQTKTIELTNQEKAISQQLRGMRQLPDDQRAVFTKKLALEIRKLPLTLSKVRLANGLANLSTEGDFGRDTLQEVTNTLAAAIQEYEQTGKPDRLPYGEMASLVRYEGMQTSLNSPQYKAAVADLDAIDRERASVDFTLTDLEGKQWNLKSLRGKIVVVNFWATWCPPCRKEIADLNKLYDKFKKKDLVVLGLSDEDASKLKEFAAAQNMKYPVLPDPGRSVHKAYHIEGIPVSMFYDRDGKLVAQAHDMPTRQQFLGLLAQAGL